MLFLDYLRNTKRSVHAARRSTHSFPVQLQALEERRLFSTLTVTSFQDSGVGSLRAEIAAAQSGDTIVSSSTLASFATLLSSSALSRSSSNSKHGHGKPTPPPPPPPPPIPTITLTTGELLVTKNLTIQGPGAGKLVISGNNASRAFEMTQGSTVNLSGLTINGSSSYWTTYPLVTPWAGYGGGILNYGTLTLSVCTISGAVHSSLGRGGGIFNDGTLNVTGCTVSSCLADGSAGSDENAEAASGAG